MTDITIIHEIRLSAGTMLLLRELAHEIAREVAAAAQGRMQPGTLGHGAGGSHGSAPRAGDVSPAVTGFGPAGGASSTNVGGCTTGAGVPAPLAAHGRENDTPGGASLAGEGGQTSRRSPGGAPPTNPHPDGAHLGSSASPGPLADEIRNHSAAVASSGSNTRTGGGASAAEPPASRTFPLHPFPEPAAVLPAGEDEGTRAPAGITVPAGASFSGGKWTEEKIAKAVQMRRQFKNTATIAKELGISAGYVDLKFSEMRKAGVVLPSWNRAMARWEYHGAAPGADDQAVADFIAKRGITKLPAAYAAPSTAEISDADKEAHRARPVPDPVYAAHAAKAHRNTGRRT